MKSKKKKNKINILIVFSKSIASLQSIELAMLFCHSGFSVKTILSEEAEKHISDEMLKDITGHSSWTNSKKPNWVKVDIDYPICIIIEPSKTFQDMLLDKDISTLSSDNPKENQNYTESIVKYIRNYCKRNIILQKKEISEQIIDCTDSNQIITLPDNLLKLREIFEVVFSKALTYISSKVLNANTNYSILGDFSNVLYIKELEKTFIEEGFEKNDLYTEPTDTAREEATIVISNDTKEIELIFESEKFKSKKKELSTDQNKVYIYKHKKGLLLINNIETRLLPEFSCQSCFSRLAKYIKVSLTYK